MAWRRYWRAEGAVWLLIALTSPLAAGCAGAALKPEGAPTIAHAASSAVGESEVPPPERQRSLSGRVLNALVDEAKRYASDAGAFLRAPASWNGSDWRRAAVSSATLGALFFADEEIDRFAMRRRSHLTDRVSGATTWIGGGGGFHIPVALLVGGVALRDANTRDMGRDALEACLMSQLLTKGLKAVVGRERPFESDGEAAFKPFSSHDSFPSGHATQAFAIASVVAMRSEGWVVPTLAYAAATVVAFDRVNDRVHFASDVFAGALVGTVTGRFLVARHRRIHTDGRPRIELQIVPIRSGVLARIRLGEPADVDRRPE